MALKVFWSDHVEELADRLLGEWVKHPVEDPFERVCIVVGEPATRVWLQRRFLLDYATRPGCNPARRILANVDFMPLPEFINNWLAAMTHGESAACRDPAAHPFSKNVLAWRIYAILRDRADDPVFSILSSYVGKSAAADRRRFDLASRLARMFDDYLASRHAMLERWERGDSPSSDPERWQCALYRILADEASTTYARDYVQALAADANPAVAFDNGFPNYSSIHVFDVADAPWPWLAMLRKISEAVPVTLWNFNPSFAYWLDNPTKKQAIRERVAALRQTLENGDNPAEQDTPPAFGNADDKLLGALASGSRGLLSHELDLAEGDCEWLGDEAATPFSSLRGIRCEVHACYSPRRELEAARDALHRFFDEHRDAHPRDALVLCADWELYSPLIEAVFGDYGVAEDTDHARHSFPPIIATGSVGGATPLTHSVEDLLDFRKNRFEVTKVFALLGVPEIRGKFGIDADGLATLRDMVRDNNIHWGRDAADVRRVTGEWSADNSGDEAADKAAESMYSFTWRRGMDRFTLDALLGPHDEAEESLVAAGALGDILPQGNVESDRARLVGCLDRFIRKLTQLRSFLQGAHTAEEWRTGLLQAVADFYEATGKKAAGELWGVREAVREVADAAVNSLPAGGTPASIPGDVFCSALLVAVGVTSRRLSTACDSVAFAPLSSGAAVQARFVWICGLNDGAFPRQEERPAFDLIGRHPSMFDVTARERDALALLKAALGARDILCLSYVGRDIRTNKDVPAAVPLTDLVEWFQASGLPFARYVHPLQSFSPRYFQKPETPEDTLPPSYSAIDFAAAKALAEKWDGTGESGNKDEGNVWVTPFPLADSGETVIDLEELAAFCSRPNWHLARKRLGISMDKAKYDLLSDEDPMDTQLPVHALAPILMGEMAPGDLPDDCPGVLAEAGHAADTAQAKSDLDNATSDEARKRFESLRVVFGPRQVDSAEYSCPEDPVVDRFHAFQAGKPLPFQNLRLNVGDKIVRLSGSRRPPVMFKNGNGAAIDHAFEYKNGFAYDSDMNAAKIRHWARHAEGESCVTVLFSIDGGRNGKPLAPALQTLRPVSPGEASVKLLEVLRLVTQPMPIDWDKANGHDELPEKLSEIFNDCKIYRTKDNG